MSFKISTEQDTKFDHSYDGPPDEPEAPTFQVVVPLTEEQVYDNSQLEFIAIHEQMLRDHVRLSADLIASGLDPLKNNTITFEWMDKMTPKVLGVKKADVVASLRRMRIKDELGAIPLDATHFVALYVELHKITCHYNGLLSRRVIAFEVDDKGKKYFYDTSTMDDFDRERVSIRQPSSLNRAGFERDLRICRDTLKLAFTDQSILDAVHDWFEKAKRERLTDIYADIRGGGGSSEFPAQKAKTAALWLDIGSRIFDTSETSPEFTAAVIQKFMWQVKRKITGHKITNHLMPVLLGGQGCGKSTFIELLLKPVAELVVDVDFRMVEDEKHVDIWDNYVMFLDEMGRATYADADTIKKAITAPSLTRRPMRSNGNISVKQNATFIGCSNRELGQLMKDATGNRRFIGLRFLEKGVADWELVNSIPWAEMWRSVDPTGSDPMLPFMDLLAEKQAETLSLSRTDAWIEQFDGSDPLYMVHASKNAKTIAALHLYDCFREFEDRVNPGHAKTSKADWEQEMNRIMKNHKDRFPFRKTRCSSGVAYVYEESLRSG